MVGGGALAGAVVAAVVEVHAVGEMREAEALARGFHLGEEFVLAVEAAVGVVAGVVGRFELAGVEDVCGDRVSDGKGKCFRKLFPRERGRVGDDGDHAVAEHFVRDIGEECGVGTAGVGDQQ